MLLHAALITILVPNVNNIPLPTKNTDDSERDTASTGPDTNDEEISRPTGRYCSCNIRHNRSEITIGLR